MNLRHQFRVFAPSWKRCAGCGMEVHDSDSPNISDTECPARVRENLSLLVASDRLTKTDTLKTMARLIAQAEDHGVDGEYTDPESNPFVDIAFQALDHLARTHPDGWRGVQRAMQYIEKRVYRL